MTPKVHILILILIHFIAKTKPSIKFQKMVCATVFISFHNWIVLRIIKMHIVTWIIAWLNISDSISSDMVVHMRHFHLLVESLFVICFFSSCMMKRTCWRASWTCSATPTWWTLPWTCIKTSTQTRETQSVSSLVL